MIADCDPEKIGVDMVVPHLVVVGLGGEEEDLWLFVVETE